MEDKQKIFEESQSLYFSTKFNKALELIDDLLEANDSNSDYHNHKGNCLRQLDKNKEALESFEKAISLNENNELCYLNKAQVLCLLDQNDEAHKSLEKYLNFNAENPFAYFLKGKAYFNQNKFLFAYENFKKVLNFDFKYTLIHYWLGVTLKELKYYEEALTEFDLHIEQTPDDFFIYLYKAHCFMKQNKFTEALIESDKAIGKRNSGETYNTKAFCLFNLNRFEEALIEIEKAFASIFDDDFNMASAYKNRALIIFKLGRPREALNDINKALENGNKSNSVFCEAKALILNGLENYEDAIYDIIKAFENSEEKPKLENLNLMKSLINKIKGISFTSSSQTPNEIIKDLEDCIN